MKMKTPKWVHLVIAFGLFAVIIASSNALFSPADSYLISCGSSQNVTFQGQIYSPDSGHPSLKFSGSAKSVVATPNSIAPFPVYQFAQIFTSTASYEFGIKKKGPHWIRLYFFPIPNSGHDLKATTLTVVTENFVLLNNFTFRNYTGSYMSREFAVNVDSNSLTLSFIPSNNSVAFVNAIEVVSIPDNLIPDHALALPSTTVSGILDRALETVYRLNMGGPLLTAQNDTIGRSWQNDRRYLHVNSSAANASVNPSTVKYPATVTPEIAPNWVYATAEIMGEANVADSNFNITWVLNVDRDFTYLVRVHLCDIIGTAMNTLVFNLYINSDAWASIDLSTLTGGLAVPFYKDFVSNSSDSGICLLYTSDAADE